MLARRAKALGAAEIGNWAAEPRTALSDVASKYWLRPVSNPLRIQDLAVAVTESSRKPR